MDNELRAYAIGAPRTFGNKPVSPLVVEAQLRSREAIAAHRAKLGELATHNKPHLDETAPVISREQDNG